MTDSVNQTYTGDFKDLCQVLALLNMLLDGDDGVKVYSVDTRTITDYGCDGKFGGCCAVTVDLEELIEGLFKRMTDDQRAYAKLAFGNLFNWF